MYDFLIKGATIVDGSGAASYEGSVAISDQRIVGVGDVAGEAREMLDGTELVVCPGFIDPHSHADMSIIQYPLAENLVMQGVTTVLGGNCGLTLAPVRDPGAMADRLQEFGFSFDIEWQSFAEWLARVEDCGTSINLAPLVGHNTVRLAVMGDDFKRHATLAEIEDMKAHIDEAMRSGAVGLSTFFDPSPGEYAATEEAVALTRVAARHGGRYVPHARHNQTQWASDDPEEYGYGIFHGPIEDAYVGRYRGYLEAIEISQRADIPLHIGHLANAYRILQPRPQYLEEAAARATLEIIDRANAQGADVTFDTIACRGGIAAQKLLADEFLMARNPALEWVQGWSREELGEQLQRVQVRERLRDVFRAGRLKLGAIHTKAHPYWMEHFRILRCDDQSAEGKNVGEIVAERGSSALDVVFDLLVEDPHTLWVQFASEKRPPGVLREFLQHPVAMPSSDTFSLPAEPASETQPTPIAYGLFPSYVDTFVKTEGVLGLEEAIHKATSLPATRFGLQDRGSLRAGSYADVVVFDFDSMEMRGDFIDPAQRPGGIEYVFVNGELVYRDGKHTGVRPGMVLRQG